MTEPSKAVAVVYPGGRREVDVTPADLARGYVETTCPACDGTGVFEITDTDSQPCVRCSTRGTVVVSL